MTYLFFLTYLGLIALGLIHHEPWLDEAHHWNSACVSKNLFTFLNQIGSEGHPYLWDSILFLFSRIHSSIEFMKLPSFLSLLTIAYVVLLRCKWPIFAQLGFLCSYFLLFEYSLISRNYSIILLFSLCIYLELAKENRNNILIAVFMLLLLQTHLLAVIPFLFFLTLYFEEIIKLKLKDKLIVFALLASGFLILVLSLLPAIENPASHLLTSNTYSTTARAKHALNSIALAYFPLPNFSLSHFWNTSFAQQFPLIKIVFIILSIIIPLIILQTKKMRYAYLIACLAHILIFLILPFSWGIRYSGVLYLVFLFSIAMEYTTNKQSKHYSIYLLSVVFLIQFVSGIFAYYQDLMRPFSNAQSVAKSIRLQPDETMFIAYPYLILPSLSAEISKPIFCPEENRETTFCNWKALSKATKQSIVRSIELKSKSSYKICLLIGNETDTLIDLEIKAVLFKNRYRLISRNNFTGAIVKSENYRVYWFNAN